MFISIIGNALVLVAIIRTSSLHSPSTVFLCCLAVSDLLVGFVAQPVYIATELHGGPSLYHAMFTLTALTCGVSLCVMAAISVDRFMALHCHVRYPNLMTTKRVIYTSATLWIINILLSSLSFWNIDVYFLAIAIGIAICISISCFLHPNLSHCSPAPNSDSLSTIGSAAFKCCRKHANAAIEEKCH